MNSTPTFSVLIPTHNRAGLLPRSVASVLGQDLSDFELLIVDDASTDETPQVVHRIADPRIRYLRRANTGGAGAARNTGIRVARGRYVSLLDDDDEYLPGFLAATFATLDGAPRDVGFSWCGVRWVKETPQGGRVLREDLWQPRFPSREEAYLAFLRARRIGTNCGVTFRRAIFDEVRPFDETLHGGAEDTELLIRLVRRFDFRVVPRVLVQVHLHSGAGLRRASAAKAADYERILERNLAALEAHPALWSELHYKTGWLHYHAGDRRRGRAFLLQALRRRPTHLKSWVGLALFELLGPGGPWVHRRLSVIRHRRRSLSRPLDQETLR